MKCMMDLLQREINIILPSLSEGKKQEVIGTLIETGVSDASHLKFVEEKDLAHVIDKISVRQLLFAWSSNHGQYFIHFYLNFLYKDFFDQFLYTY